MNEEERSDEWRRNAFTRRSSARFKELLYEVENRQQCNSNKYKISGNKDVKVGHIVS